MLRCTSLLILCIVGILSQEEGETDIIDIPEVDESSSSEVSLDGDVHVLDPLNFDGFIDTQDLVMVEFYAPWCGHCKKLAPEYDAAATELKTEGAIGVLAKVNVDDHGELGTRFGVQGFPTLKIFKKGVDEPIDYDGSRDKVGILEKMKELSDPNWTPPKSDVLELTEVTFDDIVNAQPIMLVEFFAPWCGHCKKLKPEFDKAARQLKESGILLATVDATVEKDLAKRYDVTGYPTLKIFRNGKATDYKGARKTSDIVTTMMTEKDPHTTEIISKSDMKEVEKPSDVIVVGILPGLTKESLEYQIFEELTNEFRSSYISKHSFDATFAAKTFKVSKPSLFVVYPAFYVAKKEKAFATIPIAGESSIADLHAFISNNDKPLAGDYDCFNCDKIYDAVDTVRVYTSKEYGNGFDKNTKYWQEKVANVARKYSGKDLHFVLCDETKQAADMASMKLTDLGVETVFGIRTASGDKYSPDEDTLDDMDDFEETLEEFVEDYSEGKLQVRRKSSPVPKRQTGPVTTVVGTTFEDIVLDMTKDVLIEFYAPWCGHCKELEPKYTRLANELKSEKHLVIAKIDGTANEFPGQFQVSGFPAIFLVPGAGKTAIEYDGDREVDAIKKFLKENSVLSFGGPSRKDEL